MPWLYCCQFSSCRAIFFFRWILDLENTREILQTTAPNDAQFLCYCFVEEIKSRGRAEKSDDSDGAGEQVEIIQTKVNFGTSRYSAETRTVSLRRERIFYCLFLFFCRNIDLIWGIRIVSRSFLFQINPNKTHFKKNSLGSYMAPGYWLFMIMDAVVVSSKKVILLRI